MSDRYLDVNDKKDEVLKFWTRSTIPWKLSCEVEDSKASFLTTIEKTNEITQPYKIY